jgi:N-acetylmuramic acid 6-phosphate etherase
MSMTELERLTTEARNPASEQIDRLDPLEIVRLMNAEDATVPSAVAEVAEPIAAAIGVIADRLRAGGRLVYVGAGTSGRLGVLDASECPPTFNTRPGQVVGLIAGGLDALTRPIEGAEDSTDAAVADLQQIGFSDHDVLVGIATSGRTPYVLGALHYANQLGAFTIGLACNRGSLIAELARLPIVPVVGPEVISGSTRLKAGTATKLVLNMLTTGAMVLLGKTYGNLMVDLQATNQKLADRSRRIVQALTGLSSEQAEDSLQRAGGDVKRAAVTAMRAISPQVAERLLQAAGGQLRDALELSLEAADDRLAAAETAGALSAGDLLLGVDGGGTKTVASLALRDAPAPAELARGFAGPSNPQAVGWEVARTNLERAIRGAFEAAGLRGGTAAVACLAIAGAGRPDDRRRMEQWAQRTRLAQQTLVTHDAMAVLAAADPQAIGVALISGTGSIAFARNRRGATGRSGGWGHLIGDEGSGWAIARQALQAAAQAFDGRGPETALTEALLQALDVKGPAQLLQKVYQHQADRSVLARLTPVVQQVAADGDPVARRILETAAADLATMYQTLMARMTLDADQRILALAGGTLIHVPIVRDSLLSQLKQSPWAPHRVEMVSNPVHGALTLARQATPGESKPEASARQALHLPR